MESFGKYQSTSFLVKVHLLCKLFPVCNDHESSMASDLFICSGPNAYVCTDFFSSKHYRSSFHNFIKIVLHHGFFLENFLKFSDHLWTAGFEFSNDPSRVTSGHIEKEISGMNMKIRRILEYQFHKKFEMFLGTLYLSLVWLDFSFENH